MNDDELIQRLRNSLDEVHSSEPATAPSAIGRHGAGPSGRWMAVAATVVLVAGAVVGLAVRHRGSPSSAPITSDSTTTVSPTTSPGSEPTTTIATPSASWYVLDAAGFVPSDPIIEGCCIPVPAPGPNSEMAWGRTSGLKDGLLVLVIQPTMNGEPVLKYMSYGLDATEAAALEAKVQPGSGLPYVLAEPGWELLGYGMQTMGNLTTQEYGSITGSVTIKVGDYRDELAPLALGGTFDVVTVAGQTGYRYTDDLGVHVVWKAPSGQWAQLFIGASLASRVDELIADVHESTPVQPPSTTSSTSPSATTQPSTTTVYTGIVTGIIDDGHGPKIAFVFLDSLPPQGGSIPLANFDWSTVAAKQTLNGVTWTQSSLRLTGTWDGTTFTLTEPPAAVSTSGLPPPGTIVPTPGCTTADVKPYLDQLNALDAQKLGIVVTSDRTYGGYCDTQLTATFDTPALRQALAPLGDKVAVTIVFTAVT